MATWSDDGKTFTATDGQSVEWNRGKCTVGGTEYVPVHVKTTDYAAFKADRAAKGFAVTENGQTLAGGYGEGVAENKVTLKPAKATVKAKALKKAAKTVTIKASVASGAKVTYSSSKGISMSKSGKVTIKKDTKKGAYIVTATAAEVAGYKSASAKFTVRVK